MSEALIEALSAGLQPVRRLHRPAVRTAGWLAAVLALGAVLAALADMAEVRTRMAQAPDLRWALAGAALTAVAAAWAAFQSSVPGRSAWWLAAPLPPALLWLGSSGWGCLRGAGLPGLAPATLHDAMGCVRFIALVSVPLSALLLWMLRRGCPLWPGRTAAMGGLAAAAAAAGLLTLFHPHDASVIDLAMHVAAVGAVVGASRLLAGRPSP